MAVLGRAFSCAPFSHCWRVRTSVLSQGPGPQPPGEDCPSTSFRTCQKVPRLPLRWPWPSLCGALRPCLGHTNTTEFTLRSSVVVLSLSSAERVAADSPGKRVNSALHKKDINSSFKVFEITACSNVLTTCRPGALGKEGDCADFCPISR